MPAVYLHVGFQKTGTSFLQDVFLRSQQPLAAQGLDLVPGTRRGAFHLMLCVRERYDPRLDPPAVTGALDRLAADLAAAPGSRALVSEESLSPAPDEQIRRLLHATAGREAHLVVTVRDLARQIPSAWQQQVKAGMPIELDAYVSAVRDRRGTAGRRFWANQDLPALLERWRAHLPPERIHVVTVPRPGSDPGLLLARYCAVLGVDPATLDTDVPRTNESIGFVQATLMSRVNGRLSNEDRRRDAWGRVGKRYFAQQVLAAQRGTPARLPEEHRVWCDGLADEYAAVLREGGYDVVGDVDDLRPADTAYAASAPDASDATTLEAAVDALATILGHQLDEVRQRRRDGRPKDR